MNVTIYLTVFATWITVYSLCKVKTITHATYSIYSYNPQPVTVSLPSYLKTLYELTEVIIIT